MNWKLFPFLAFMLVIASSCSTSENKETGHDENESAPTSETLGELVIAEDLPCEKFNELIGTKPGIVLDVRTPEEYEAGHLSEAVNINFYDEDFEQQLEALDKTLPIYVYCQGGGRSGKAKNMMTENGFLCVYNLEDGYGKWKP